MVSRTALRNIGLIMVSEGLLRRQDFERAVRRKEESGGSLALNLVLEGAVDEIRLAEYYARKYRLNLAAEAMLAGVDRTVFSLIPLEICYESGILPLYLKDQETLVVGLVDPTDRELLIEAGFFAGYELEPRLIMVSQMARHFERLSGRPWKVDAAQVITGDRSTAKSSAISQAVDALLEQTTALDQHVDAVLAASMDVTYGPPTMSLEEELLAQAESIADQPDDEGPNVWMMEGAAVDVSSIRILAPGISHAPVLIEAQDVAGAMASSPLSRHGGARVEEAAFENPFRRIPTRPIHPALSAFGIEPAGRDEAVDLSPSTGSMPPARTGSTNPMAPALADSRVEPDEWAGSTEPTMPALPISSEEPSLWAEAVGVMEGEAVTRTGPSKVLGIDLDRFGDHPRSVEQVPARRTLSEMPTTSDAPIKVSVPALPTFRGEAAGLEDRFMPVEGLAKLFANADPMVEAAIRQARVTIAAVQQRDELGEAIVASLAPHYQTIAVMTLNGPRAVVWRCQCGGARAPDMVGRTIEIESQGILHRVIEQRQAYWGPLPVRSRLRSALRVAHARQVLVAPVELRGRTILLMVLDNGKSPFPEPGRSLVDLLAELSDGLQRVILMRKHGR